MEAVRDLLFGKKNTEINERFTSLESGLREAIDRVEERVNNRFESLNHFLRAEMETAHAEIRAVEEKVRAEASQRESDDRNIGEIIGALKTGMEDRFQKNERIANEMRDTLRAEAFEQTRRLTEDLSSVRKELTDRIKRDIESLSQSATHRQDLSKFLIEMGMKIQPGEEPSEGKAGAYPRDLNANEIEEIESQVELSG